MTWRTGNSQTGSKKNAHNLTDVSLFGVLSCFFILLAMEANALACYNMGEGRLLPVFGKRLGAACQAVAPSPLFSGCPAWTVHSSSGQGSSLSIKKSCTRSKSLLLNPSAICCSSFSEKPFAEPFFALSNIDLTSSVPGLYSLIPI